MIRTVYLGLVAAALTAVGWGGPFALTGAEAGEATGRQPAVVIQLFQFIPGSVEVKAGTRVTWTNHDDITHTVTSGAPGNKDGRFEGKLEEKGSTYSVDLTQPGTYEYFCSRHQSMRGQIRVAP